MLLASIGENIPPSLIEVLSGVSLGGYWYPRENLLFFGWQFPDRGLTNTLRILGFDFEEKKTPKTGEPPLEKLKKDLSKGTGVIGPLDMHYLIYNPDYENLSGADHFVFVYQMNENEVTLHDPAGFPCVSLSLDDLKSAWGSPNLSYGKESYCYWANPKRVYNPSAKEIYQSAISYFQTLYQISKEKAARDNEIIGKEAILTCAKAVESEKISQGGISHLTGFAVPLGAKRALDYATFFEPFNKLLSELKQKQARLFGKSQTLAMKKDWQGLGKTLKQLAEVEEEIKKAILSS
jgi:hypothetical protein